MEGGIFLSDFFFWGGVGEGAGEGAGEGVGEGVGEGEEALEVRAGGEKGAARRG